MLNRQSHNRKGSCCHLIWATVLLITLHSSPGLVQKRTSREWFLGLGLGLGSGLGHSRVLASSTLVIVKVAQIVGKNSYIFVFKHTHSP